MAGFRRLLQRNDADVVRSPSPRTLNRVLSRLSVVTRSKLASDDGPKSGAGDYSHPDSGVEISRDTAEASQAVRGISSMTQPEPHQSLWDEAYEALRNESDAGRKRIEQYEALLSIKVQAVLDTEDGDGNTFLSTSRVVEALDGGHIPAHNIIRPEQRRMQMKTILELGSQEADEKRLRLIFGKREVLVSEQLARLSSFIQWSQAWVGMAAQAYPEATMAWAAISLALPLVTNPFAAREAHAAGYKEATGLTRYYASLERAYLSTSSAGRPLDLSNPAISVPRTAIEEGIRDLYKATLDYQIQTVLRLYRKRFQTFFRDVALLDDWADMSAAISSCDSKVRGLIQEMRSAQTVEALASIQGELEQSHMMQQGWNQRFSQVLDVSKAIAQQLESFTTKQLAHNERQQQDTQALHSIMKSVVDDGMTKRLASFLAALDGQVPGGANPDDAMARIPQRLPNTANWALSNEGYRRWLQSSSGILLVSCPPGCGKSVLSKYLIESALPESGKRMVAYFFFDQHTIAQALCALLHQIFKIDRSLAVTVLPQFEQQTSIFTSRRELWNILVGIKSKLYENLSIVFDAIDQCKDDDVGDFLGANLANKNFHIAITTRPFSELTLPFDEERSTVVRIRGENETPIVAQEVQLFIEHNISQLRWPDDGKMLLKERMTKVNNPTYLWARLIFDHVRSKRSRYFHPTLKNIRNLVEGLPENFRGAYDKIMHLTKDPEKLLQAMSIIIAAQRPLTIHEMNMAMHISEETTTLLELENSLLGDEYFEMALREWCSSFIIVQHGRVFLLHETAREFFTTRNTSPADQTKWGGSIPMPQAHLLLAECCLRSVVLEDLLHEGREPILVGDNGLPREDLLEPRGFALAIKEDHPQLSFVIYAYLHWSRHVREAEQLPTGMLGVYERLCNPEDAMCRSWLAFYIHHESSPAIGPDYLDTSSVKCLLGHIGEVKGAIKADSQLLRPPSERGGTELTMPLLFAAVAGKHRDLTEWLLSTQNANPNDAWGPHTPLVQVIIEGDPDMLKLVPLFLEKGAQTGFVGLEDYETHDITPAFAAARHGSSVTAEQILCHEERIGSACTASVACSGETPLHVVKDGATAVALLKHGADPFIRRPTAHYLVPLSTNKPVECKRAIVSYLAKARRLSPEMLAMFRESLDFARSGPEVELYFEHGVTIHTPNSEGQIPIFSISELQGDWLNDPKSQVEILQVLLQHCNSEIRDDKGRTPLLHYVARGSTAASHFLLSSGVDLSIQDNSGLTVLHHVFNRFRPRPGGSSKLPADSTIHAVLKAVAKYPELLHRRTQDGRTALHYACQTADTSHVQLLLDRGLDIEAKDHEGNTALLMVTTGHDANWSIFDLLVRQKADVQACDNKGRTMLHLIFGGSKWPLNVKLLKSMLEIIPNPNIQDYEGRTPLMACVNWAMSSPDVRLAMLLERGADCTVRDSRGWTVLHYIHPGGDWSAFSIESLLQRGADIFARTTDDETALHTIIRPTGAPIGLSRWPWNQPVITSWSQPLLVSVLIRHGAEVDARRRDQKTPLHMACLNKCHNTAKVLLEAGADASAVDADGNTPLDLVHGEKRRQRFARLLEETTVTEKLFEGPLTEPLDDDDS